MGQGFSVAEGVKMRNGAILWFLTMAALGSWFAVMFVDNEPPYIYDAEQSRIIPSVAKPESMVVADWKVAKVNRICSGTSQRRFRDKATNKTIIIDSTPIARSVKVGDNRLTRAFQLPPGLGPEVAYSSDICFRCNVLQHIFPTMFCVMTPELSFRIEP